MFNRRIIFSYIYIYNIDEIIRKTFRLKNFRKSIYIKFNFNFTHILWRRAATQPWWGPRSANTWTWLDLLVCPFTLKHRERERLRVKQSTVYVVNISRFHGGNVSSTGIDTTLPQSDTFNLVLPWDRGTNVPTPGLRFYDRPVQIYAPHLI